jgi:DNA repair exonuclease SbcCD ATPase subunit
MEFKKVTIRNYRIHREQIVDFDQCLTLIGGENEKGKSTIAEAIHRALFFKANGNSAQHKSMKSTIYQEDPEVELIFLSKGKEFKLNKKFGSRGGVSLSEPSMTTLNGEEAEAMLSTLIQTDTSISGSALDKKWPLLWVWQGVSSDNPVTFIEESHNKLIQRLQTYGASTVLSSNFDKQVSESFAQTDATNYVSKGAARAGSDLKRAEDDLNDVKSRLEIAEDKVRSLEEASDNYEKYKLQQETNQKKYDSIKEEETKLLIRLDKIKGLESRKQLQDSNFQIKDSNLKQLLSIQAEILKHESEVQYLTSKLNPSKKVLNEKKAEVSSNLDAVKENNIQLNKLKEEEKLYKSNVEICKIVQDLASQNKGLAKLKEVKLQADKLNGQIREEEVLLNKLPVVTALQIQDLQNIESEIGKAQVKLDTIATTFEVLNSKEPVLINGQKQSAGVKSNFAEKFEIKVGPDTTILITPGGGDSLGVAREKLQHLQDALKSQLSKLGYSKVEDVVICLRSRETHLRTIENLKNALSHLDANDIDLQIGAVANEIEIKQTLLVSKGTTSGIDIQKYNADNVITEITSNEEQLEAVFNQIHAINGVVVGYSTKNEKLVDEIDKLQEEIHEDDKKLTSSKNTLEYIFKKDGDKQSIDEKINESQILVSKEREKLDQILKELGDLSIDTVKVDQDRVARSLASSLINLNDTRDKLRTTELILTNNGTENPSDTLNKLEEKFIYVNDYHYATSQKAKAIKMLHELFTQEQQQLADKLTKPLAEKIKYYLEPVFGRTVNVSLKQEAGQFKEFLISRDNMGTFSFDSLSGGTKEQFSAAVRLAMAEVLSADFDDRLPILFDDAFTNSDENRILNIQPMLDRASQKGVQVIVLTCHPAAYANLGAKQVMLN